MSKFKSYSSSKQALILISIVILLGHSYWIVTNHFTLITYSDMYQQQMVFYRDAWEKLHSGHFVFWTWNSLLGNNFYGANTFYYLFSPFAWFIVLFPKEMIIHAMLIANIVKYIVMAYFMLRLLTYMGVQRLSALMVGTLSYVASGPAIMNYWYNHFNDYFCFVPLLILMIDKAIKENKWRYLPIVIAILLAINLYFSFSLSIFISIYIAFRYLMIKPFNSKKFVKFYSKYIGCYLVGLSIAMVSFLPTVYQLLTNPRVGQFKEAWELTTINKVLMLLWQAFVSLLYPPSAIEAQEWFYELSNKWQSLSLYSSILLIFLLPQLFKLLSKRYLTLMSIFAGLLLVIYCVPVLNSAVSGFGNVTFRWSYIIVLFIAIVLAYSIEHIELLEIKYFKYSFALFIVFTIVFLQYYQEVDLYQSEESKQIFIYANVIPTAIIGITAFYILSCNAVMKVKMRLIILVVMFQSIFNFILFITQSSSGQFTNVEDWPRLQGVKMIQKQVDELKQNNLITDQQRIYLDTALADDTALFYNLGLAFNINQPRLYHSLYNSQTNDFYNWSEQLEQAPYTSWTRAFRWNQHNNMLLNISGMVTNQLDISYIPVGFTLTKSTKNLHIYNDQYQLGYVQQFPYAITTEQLLKTPAIVRDNILNQALVLTHQQIKHFNYASYQAPLTQEIIAYSQSIIQQGKKVHYDQLNQRVNIDHDMIFKLAPFTSDGEMYVANTEGVTYTIDNIEYNQQEVTSFSREGRTFAIPYHKGSVLRIKVDKGQYSFDVNNEDNNALVFWNQPQKIYQAIQQQRHIETNNEVLSDNKYAVTVTNPKKQILFLAIPNNKGWNIKVDGQPVHALTVHGGFMGLKMEQGQHRITMNYVSPGFYLGLSISIVASLSYVFVLYYRRNK